MFKPEQKLNPERFIQSTHLTTYVLNLNFIEEQNLNLNQFKDSQKIYKANQININKYLANQSKNNKWGFQ